MFEADVLRVMIASPTDVADARDAVERAIVAWNAKHAQHRSVVLLPWRWETSAVPGLTGPPQTLLNEQGVDQADIVIALLGSRLGSPTANSVSGTVEEIERARARGVPVHLYFSIASLPSDVDLDQLQGLRTFKDEIRSRGLYAEFSDLDRLESDVDRALTYDVDRAEQRRTDAYFQVDTDRIYELYESRWSFARSQTTPDAWSGTQLLNRRLVSRSRDGLERFTVSLSRETDDQYPFGPLNSPLYELDPDSSRSDGGGIALRPPHKSAGGTFAQNVVLEPPLDADATARLLLHGFVPVFKYANRDRLIPSTQNSRLGLRDWDYVSITVQYPIARLVYSAFFPDDLRAQILGVRVGRGVIDVAEGARLRREGHVTQQHIEYEGITGIELTLDIPRPRLKWTYRLCWRPPEH